MMMQDREAMIAFAAVLVQGMPARLSGMPTRLLRLASKTPEYTHER